MQEGQGEAKFTISNITMMGDLVIKFLEVKGTSEVAAIHSYNYCHKYVGNLADNSRDS